MKRWCGLTWNIYIFTKLCRDFFNVQTDYELYLQTLQNNGMWINNDGETVFKNPCQYFENV